MADKKSVIQRRRHKLKQYLEKAGVEIREEKVITRIFYITLAITLFLSLYLIYLFSNNYSLTWKTVGVSIFVVWVLLFFLIVTAQWITVYVFLDLRIYHRKLEIEEVLPDYLQLTASNIKAGMTIDRALWYAVRPRFGVLANEIEEVAKETIGGVELKESLLKFAGKYDSVILKRSMNMIIEGIEAGGKIGDLLERLAHNIKEQKIMVKEIAASVTTYIIFITFASVIAAPFLFALSGALIVVIQNLGGSLSEVYSSATSLVPFVFKGASIEIKNFKIFASVALVLSSVFSAMIIASIKKGNVKAGFKYIPMFIMISLTLYFLFVSSAEYLIGLVF